MCTAITYKTKDFYFGRTLDHSCSYGEQVVITPRNYPFVFKEGKAINVHYAMIGMAKVIDDYPLYYEAINEKGLGIAGLNFIGNAIYQSKEKGKNNIAQYEWIPWILCQCQSVKEVLVLLKKTNLTNDSFHKDLPTASLHWMIADKEQCITIEYVKEGIKIYDNPMGVLTNNPTFDKQVFALNNYMNLSNKEAKNTFSQKLDLKPYSLGMGTIGLPGDFSSQSRFIRACFVKMNSISKTNENESVNQFFHILNAVEQPKGCCKINRQDYEITRYTSCCNVSKGIYYYTTYNNHQIIAIYLNHVNLEDSCLFCYDLVNKEQFFNQN